jgi:hypothetical protein
MPQNNLGVDEQFLYAVPIMGSSTSQSSVKKCKKAPCVTSTTCKQLALSVRLPSAQRYIPGPPAAGTTSSANLQRVQKSRPSHTPSSLAAALSQHSDAAKSLDSAPTFAFHPLVTADASIFPRSKSSSSFENRSGSSCSRSSAVSAIPVSLFMSLTSCNNGRRTNGTSGRDSAGPRLNAAVWMVRRSGDANTISTSR